jgi:hypothetical protein
MPFSANITYKQQPVPIDIEYNGKNYKGAGVPVSYTCKEGVCFELDITLNNQHLGIIKYDRDQWKMDNVHDKGLVEAIGNEIMLWYE